MRGSGRRADTARKIFSTGAAALRSTERARRASLVRLGVPALRRQVELRHAELPFEAVELGEVDRADDVHDGELARLARDDGEPVGDAAIDRDVDVDVGAVPGAIGLEKPLP